jgi:hypothetical protein
MVKHSVWVLGAQEGAREDHSVESDIILAHKLIKLYVLGVLPPLLPLILSVVSSNRQVSNRRIKPYIEHLLLILFEGNGSAPLEVASDAPSLEAFLEESAGELD